MSNSIGFLLDTNIFLWSLEGNKKLTKSLQKILKDPNNRILVSIASAWEISIKHKKGKLPLKTTFQECFTKSPFETLDIKLPHIFNLEKLPFIHNDPFDRLLIAQSQAENLTLITSDQKIAKYDIDILMC